LNIAAEDFPEARRAIGNLTQESPDARTLTIMAAIERGEGAPDAIVKGWLARAVTAPRGPQWTCENCHNIQANWTPICNNCAAFDTLEWTTAPVEEYQSQVGTSMLPLIVGEIEDNTRTPATVDSPPVEPEEAEILPTDGLDTAPKAESERAEK
jgi:HemY protein